MLLVEAIPRTGDRNLMTMALADEQMIFFVRGAKTFALGGTSLSFWPSSVSDPSRHFLKSLWEQNLIVQ